MSKPQHPYPKHVVEAMTLAYEDHWAIPETNSWACSCGNFSTPGGGGNAQHEVHKHITQVMLQALWDANRVDTWEQLENVPDFASLVDNEGFTYRTYELRNPKVFPVNIIYWGDRDE